MQLGSLILWYPSCECQWSPIFPIVSTEKSTQQIPQNQADTVLHKTLVFACVRGTAVAHALRFATEASDALEAWRLAMRMAEAWGTHFLDIW